LFFLVLLFAFPNPERVEAFIDPRYNLGLEERAKLARAAAKKKKPLQ